MVGESKIGWGWIVIYHTKKSDKFWGPMGNYGSQQCLLSYMKDWKRSVERFQ